MYFGRVSPNYTSDGFLVTQFLADDVAPEAFGNVNTDNYSILSGDAFGAHNIINGKIIDFGAVFVEKKDQ